MTGQPIWFEELQRRRMTGVAAVAVLVILSNGHNGICQTRQPGGFWKCRTGSLKGEFGGEDILGLAAHTHISTDCALNWSDGHGRTYCFSSRPSLEEFESNPSELLEKAGAFWRQSHRAQSNPAK